MKLLCISDIHGDVARYPVASLPDADYVVLAGDLTDRGINSPAEIAAVEGWLGDLRLRYTYVLYILGNHDVDMADDYFNYEHIGGVIVSVDKTLDAMTFPDRAIPFLLPEYPKRSDYGRSDQTKYSLIGISLSPCFDMPGLENAFERMNASPARDVALWEYLARNKRDDIIVSHAPPLGILDTTSLCLDTTTTSNEDGTPRHIGSPGLRQYIEQNSPLLVICGHVHEAAGIAFHGSTTIVNCAQTPTLVEITEAGECIVPLAQAKGEPEE